MFFTFLGEETQLSLQVKQTGTLRIRTHVVHVTLPKYVRGNFDFACLMLVALRIAIKIVRKRYVTFKPLVCIERRVEKSVIVTPFDQLAELIVPAKLACDRTR